MTRGQKTRRRGRPSRAWTLQGAAGAAEVLRAARKVQRLAPRAKRSRAEVEAELAALKEKKQLLQAELEGTE